MRALHYLLQLLSCFCCTKLLVSTHSPSCPCVPLKILGKALDNLGIVVREIQCTEITRNVGSVLKLIFEKAFHFQFYFVSSLCTLKFRREY